MSNNTEEVNIRPVCGVYPLGISAYADITISILSLLTIFIGITSWVIIKKFRRFKNFIILSIIFNNAINAALRSVNWECIIKIQNNDSFSNALYFLYHYFGITLNYWLLVLGFKFYLDLVKVYNNYISKQYLKANLFAWGLPLMLVTICLVILPLATQYSSIYVFPIQMTYVFVPLIINIILYFIIVCTLFTINCNEKLLCTSRRSLYRSLLLLTVVLSTTLVRYFGTDIWYMIFGPLQDIGTIVYFLTISLNMTVWRDYYKRYSDINNDLKTLPV